MARVKPAPRAADGKGGPYLLAALLCRDARIEDGLPTYSGVASGLRVSGPEAAVPMVLVVVVAPGVHVAPTRIGIDVIDPQGRRRTMTDATMRSMGKIHRTWIEPVTLQTEVSGRVWFVISINGREATRVPLEMTVDPQIGEDPGYEGLPM